ncbi:MYND-type zinc finger protein mub1 [Ancistrocladus abbreviatus]
MSRAGDRLEIKFRLSDGTDIGPRRYPSTTTVAALKESIIAQWPKDKENPPKAVRDVKLISAGRILDNNRTVADYRSSLSDISDGVTTMHAIIQPSAVENENHAANPPEEQKCACVIL